MASDEIDLPSPATAGRKPAFDPFAFDPLPKVELPERTRHEFAHILLHSADTDDYLGEVFARHTDTVLALRQNVSITLAMPYVSISFQGEPLVECLTLEEAGLVHNSK